MPGLNYVVNMVMSKGEREENQPSDYTKYYIELLEEYGENYVFSLDEFDKLTNEALFPDSDIVLSYFLRYNMIFSHKGGIELKLLDTKDPAFQQLPEPDRNAICSFYLKENREHLNR